MAIEELPPLVAPGQRLGRYRLTQRLAVGGMAEVYLAVASGRADFRKVVAIKRLLPQHALDPQLMRMFLDEARLMARLSHPNVTQVVDVGEGAGGEVPYFVMEYSHGTDLRGVLNAAEGPLPIEQALAIASAVAAGLHHAHELRAETGQPLDIVHRDVSPSNVLISFDGTVRVSDFGVAKWSEQRSFTHQGQLKGKFAHMSPEQCRGEALDRRSDVFALGTLLYEMITGSPPFVAESDYDLLSQIVTREAPAPQRPGSEVPAPLAAIIMRSLRRARDDRYSTAQALQLDLEAFAREQRLVVSPLALAAYLESLFGARVTEWRHALESGRTLAEHLELQSAAGASREATRTLTDAFAPGMTAPAASEEATTGVGAAVAAAATAAATTAATVATATARATATAIFSAQPPPSLARGAGAGARTTWIGLAAVVVAAAGTATWLAARHPAGGARDVAADKTQPAPTATVVGAARVLEPAEARPAVGELDRPASRWTLSGAPVLRATRDEHDAASDRARPSRHAPAPARPQASAQAGVDDTAALTRASAPAPAAPASSASPAPTPDRAPVPAPLKVWDPDSPVPP